jgi:hypothetical protein
MRAWQYLIRRFLAKVVDLGVFMYVAVLGATWLFGTELGVRSIVHAFATCIWAVGVFVVADALCTITLGLTPGELLAGIRVRKPGDASLNWSDRQDRTVDSFVEGTLRFPRLVRALSRGGSRAVRRRYARAAVAAVTRYDRDLRAWSPPFCRWSARRRHDEHVYTADLDNGGRPAVTRTAFLWFTENRYEWLMSVTRPSSVDPRSEDATSLALRLMHTTKVLP